MLHSETHFTSTLTVLAGDSPVTGTAHTRSVFPQASVAVGTVLETGLVAVAPPQALWARFTAARTWSTREDRGEGSSDTNWGAVRGLSWGTDWLTGKLAAKIYNIHVLKIKRSMVSCCCSLAVKSELLYGASAFFNFFSHISFLQMNFGQGGAMEQRADVNFK